MGFTTKKYDVLLDRKATFRICSKSSGLHIHKVFIESRIDIFHYFTSTTTKLRNIFCLETKTFKVWNHYSTYGPRHQRGTANELVNQTGGETLTEWQVTMQIFAMWPTTPNKKGKCFECFLELWWEIWKLNIYYFIMMYFEYFRKQIIMGMV